MKYFSIDELYRSATADAKKIMNKPGEVEIQNLCALIENVLDPAREKFGRPIYVTSGYRSAALNKAVGGVANSDHLRGMAADLKTGTVKGNEELFDIIRKTCKFKQLINEKNYSWIHVSYDPNNLKQQILAL